MLRWQRAMKELDSAWWDANAAYVVSFQLPLLLSTSLSKSCNYISPLVPEFQVEWVALDLKFLSK